MRLSDRIESLVDFEHGRQVHKGDHDKDPVRNTSRCSLCFPTSPAAVPSTVIYEADRRNRAIHH